MDSKQIEQLLEKYWSCETSLEEEQYLRDFFKTETVPENLKETAELFRYFEQQKKQQLSDTSFDHTVVKEIKANTPRAKGVNLYYNFARIAAGVAVLAAATYFIRQEIRKSYPKEVADTYSDPKLAFEETKKALMMISKGFGKAQKETEKIRIFNEAEQKIKNKQNEKEEGSAI